MGWERCHRRARRGAGVCGEGPAAFQSVDLPLSRRRCGVRAGRANGDGASACRLLVAGAAYVGAAAAGGLSGGVTDRRGVGDSGGACAIACLGASAVVRGGPSGGRTVGQSVGQAVRPRHNMCWTGWRAGSPRCWTVDHALWAGIDGARSEWGEAAAAATGWGDGRGDRGADRTGWAWQSAGGRGNVRAALAGLLASHYAPDASVRLNADTVRADEAVLAFGPPPPGATVVFQLSTSRNLTEAAANSVFVGLRELDTKAARLGLTGIAVMPVPERGLGLAINDRLRRAAAPREQH